MLHKGDILMNYNAELLSYMLLTSADVCPAIFWGLYTEVGVMPPDSLEHAVSFISVTALLLFSSN